MRLHLPAALFIVATLLNTNSTHAQAAPRPQLRVAASSFASVEVHLNARPIGRDWYEEDAGLAGPARITIRYGQPHARGRKIVGGLIPNDSVWRFGANEATTLHTDLDMTIGGFAIPRGDYTLYLAHAKDTWSLIVNSGTGTWGTDRNPAKDLGRITMKARTTTDNEDALTIYLDPQSAKPSSGYASLDGTMRIRWGTIELSAPWTIKQ